MKHFISTAVIIALSIGCVNSQSTLTSGDIAIYGVNTYNPDDFGFVLLVDISSGTEIHFTDNGWKSDNTFRGGEGTVTWTAPEDLNSGTIILYGGNADFESKKSSTERGAINLSGEGDQIIAYQGESGSPTFIFAIQTNSNRWQAEASDANTSCIPSGLQDGVNAVAVGRYETDDGEWDNACYDKSLLIGTRQRILAEISNNTNWDGKNTTNRYDLSTGFSFTINSVSEIQWLTTAASTDWKTNSNWDLGIVPTSAHNVTIPSSASNYPVITNAITSAAECNNLSIQSGASLTINATKALSVYGNLDIATSKAVGTLNILSDATGTGSLLLRGTSTGSATVQQYIPGYGEASNHWHLISTAVNCCDIPSCMTPDASPYDLYYWQETTNQWYNHNDGSFNDSQICTGKGYLVAYQENTSLEFCGSPNAGTIISGTDEMPSISYTTDQGNGWNLIGNPYSCAIDWDLISKTENIAGAIYVRDGINGQYISWNGLTGDLSDGVIPAMNGFWVKANASDQQISISPADQLHSSTNHYKSDRDLENHLKITISGNDFTDNTYIMLMDSATEAFDSWTDAYKLFGVAAAPQLYSKMNETKYSINVLPNSEQELIIPIHIKIGAEGDYQLQFNGVESFKDLNSIVLLDHLTLWEYDLKTIGELAIHSNVTDDFHRFTLTIQKNGTGENGYTNRDPIRIFNDHQCLFIHDNNSQMINGILTIYDLTGKLVYTEQIKNQIRYSKILNLKRGNYIVRLNSKTIHNQKIIIN
ncbi:MAG: T9SS type A sorting domain-containing protein [Bacteroidales bacterium]|nr:T9SS type A sorting domain-containing protein [Bacteroidales bacterium]